MTAELTAETIPTPGYPRQFLSLVSVASLAGVTLDAVDRWVRTGQLRAIRIADDQWRVERTVLESFLRVRPVSLTVVPPLA